MEQFDSLFQVQMCIGKGKVEFPPIAIECLSCGQSVENQCSNCGDILIPNGLPYVPDSILTPEHGWVAIVPTLCGLGSLPFEDQGRDLSAHDRARVLYQKYVQDKLLKLEAKGFHPQMRVVLYQSTDVLMRSKQ